MKNIRKILLAAVLAAMLALGACSLAACNETQQPRSEYTLTFMSGTVPYDTVTALEGDEYKSKMKGDPYRVNYVFDGWSLTQNGEVVELPAKMPSENRTYYAVFSAWFNIRLNAGIGTIPAEQATISAKEGDNLYDLVKSVTPAVSDGDATFAGWFLRGSDPITATSGQKMPSSNVEVVAKYEVGYKINIYKETEYDTGEYGGVADEVKTGTAYVGDKVMDIPQYSGYHYDMDKENAALSANLDKSLAQNTFSLYYKLNGYEVVFNANLPAEVEYSGEMDAITCGYGQKNDTPNCDFVADGYRFLGWATSPDGEIEYYTDDEFSVERATTFYAKWVKGLTELAGLSSDRIYLIEDRDTNLTVPYLERVGFTEDLAGEYDLSKSVFTFKNPAATQNADKVLLRGIADTATETFTYLNVDGSAVYRLQNVDGEVDAAVTLSLADDGTAAYNDNGENLTGNYSQGEDGSLMFVGGETEFAFRLVYDSETGLTNFMIRGDEYGMWNNVTQACVVDTAYTLGFDGYGHATMYAVGLSSSLQNVTTSFSGIYQYSSGEGAYAGDNGTEIVVMLYNGSTFRQFACLLMTGEYRSSSSIDTTVYTNVYLERFEITLYGAPAGDTELDTATADKIVLSGYGVDAESATYTYKNENETVTVKGRYVYDNTVGTLRIVRADGGADLLFEVSVSDGVPLFEPVNELFGQYEISGLDYSEAMFRFYTFHIYNNNRAALALIVPMSDSFYGNAVFEYTRMIVGEYTVAIEGKNDGGEYDERGNVYEFTADVNATIANYIYYLYGNIFSYPLDVSGFGRFRFQFVYDAETGEIKEVIVTARGDFQGGYKVTYNGVEYTLDGFGNAIAEIDGKEVSLKYAYGTSLGVPILSLYPDPDNTQDSITYLDAHGTGNFVELNDAAAYRINNAGTVFYMMLMENGTALLALRYNSYLPFSYGKITWEDESRTYGKYERDESVFSDIYNALNVEYAHFKFTRVAVTETNSQGEEVTYNRYFIYEFGNTAANSDNNYVITDADGNELTLGRNDNTATYIVKGEGEQGDATYSGTYNYLGADTVMLVYTEDETEYAVKFKLAYNANGAIASFAAIGREAGYYVSYEDGKSYIGLTGIKAGEEAGVFAATYTLYNEATEAYENIEGTYRYNTEGRGYDFTYATGEKDADGNDVTETFTFALGIDGSGILFFRKYVMELGFYVRYLTASIGSPVNIGVLTGGGYENQVLTLYPSTSYETQFVGTFEYDEEAYVWVFSATNGSVFYIRSTTFGLILLDSTYVRETNGIFELSEPIDVDVPAFEGAEATEDTPAVEPFPAHTAHTTRLEMTGMAIAYLHYDYTDDNNEVTERVVTGLYVQYATNGFAFLRFVEDGMTEVLFRFRLMTSTDSETGTVTYIAEIADMDYFGTFANDDLTQINLNGFDTAYYIDEYGRMFAGAYEVLDAQTRLIHIRYVDYYNYKVYNVYAQLDPETDTFVIVDAPAEDNG